MSKQVYVEIGDEGLPIRIFRTKDWRDLPVEKVRLMDKSKAVLSIRQQVYARSFQPSDIPDYEAFAECEQCGRNISCYTMEMNEKGPKGKNGGKTGGEVSLVNF